MAKSTWGRAQFCVQTDDLAAPVIEVDVDSQAAGPPIPPFDGVMAEATFWANMANPDELAAYTLACYARLAPARQAAFLAYVQRRAA